MKKIIAKTFGGITAAYYFRHLFFGVVIAAILFALQWKYIVVSFVFFVVISALLYPYSRFVYETITGFIMGDNFIITNTMLFLIFKIIMMVLCFGFAIFIAPIGLLYLYFYHTKNKTFDEDV